MLFFCFVRTNFLFFRSDRQRTLARKFDNLDSGQTKRRTKLQDHCLQFGAIFSLVFPIINLCEAPAIAGIFAAWVAELTFAAGLAEGRNMKKHEETYMQTADHCKLVREMMRNAHNKYWCFMHSMPICYCCRFTDMCRTECHSWDTVEITVYTTQEALARVLIFICFSFCDVHFCMDLDQRASQGGPSSHVTLKTICGAVRHRDVKERSSLCVFVNLFIQRYQQNSGVPADDSLQRFGEFFFKRCPPRCRSHCRRLPAACIHSSFRASQTKEWNL